MIIADGNKLGCIKNEMNENIYSNIDFWSFDCFANNETEIIVTECGRLTWITKEKIITTR
jgi:hypothetical protein